MENKRENRNNINMNIYLLSYLSKMFICLICSGVYLTFMHVLRFKIIIRVT